MDKYGFDTPVDRQGTRSVKWDRMPGGAGKDILPMWVADMDFRTAPAIREALLRQVEHGIFGYAVTTDEDWQAIMDWYRIRHNLALEREWLVSSPGVVASIKAAVDTLTAPGGSVVIQPPVYPPFFSVIRDLGRNLVQNPLLRDPDGVYRMDLAHLERCFRDGARAMILCSPHNPVGRVWTSEELCDLAELCVRYDVRVISDEIHCDIVMSGCRHTPLMAVPGMRERTVALYSVTKTFNLGGIHISTAAAPDRQLRRDILERLRRFGLGEPGILAFTAQTAAYRQGGEWADALVAYIDGNISLMHGALRNAGLPCARPEGTYLMWADCRNLGAQGEALTQLFINKAGIAVFGGAEFGQPDHVRINVAAPREYVARAAEGILRMTGRA